MKKIKALIMAAGQGTRLSPLTDTVPKPIVRSMGTSTLEENLDNLLGKVSKVVIIVGYLKEKIIHYVGKNYKGLEIVYVDEGVLKGTAYAAYSARKVIGDDQVLILNGDDVYEKNVIDKITNSDGGVVVGKVTKNWQNYGILKADKNGKFEKIVEKPKKFVGDLVNIGCYKVGSDFFNYFKNIEISERGEYEITDMITAYAKDYSVRIVKIKSGWHPNSYPWDLLDFTQRRLRKSNDEISGVVEEGVVVKGNLMLGKNSVLRSGVYINGDFYIGEDCEVGTDCYLSGFGSIDDGVVIEKCTEVTGSILGKGTRIGEQSIVRDSVVGNSVNLGEKIKIVSSPKNGETVKYKVNGKEIDTVRKKLGAVIGDNVKLSSRTLVYPGTKIAKTNTRG